MIGNMLARNSGRQGAAITIGMPVFNASATVVPALTSVLSQDLDGLRVIVSDNASTDGTGELVEMFAQQDTRVHYIRQEENRGAYPNFNFVLELANTPYFAWAASDDTQDPDFYRRCIETLEGHPEAVLCHADADETIAGESNPFVRYEQACGSTQDTVRRYLEVHRRFPDLHVYGVFRTTVAQRVGGMDLGPSGDIAFCRKMALEGPFCYAKGTVHHRVISESWKTTQDSMGQAILKGSQHVRPSTHLLRTSRRDILTSRLPTWHKTVLFLAVTAREGQRRLMVLVVGFMGKFPRIRSSRQFALTLFQRLFSKGTYVILDEQVFLRRIVRPTLRWNVE